MRRSLACWAALAACALAAPRASAGECSRATMAALAKGVVSIDSAEPIVAGAMSFCRIEGRVATAGEGADAGSARFEANLPQRWNGALLFLGGDGFDGSVPAAPAESLAAGYATLGTDSGHAGGSLDIGWMRGPSGAPSEAALADYAFRARHQVDAKARPLIARWYGAGVKRAYFVGCPSGGREALIEAQRHPEAFDGFIACNPWVNPRSVLLSARDFRLLTQAPISPAKLAAVRAAALTACDRSDGVADGLVQNPAACAFDPTALAIGAGLTVAQADAVAASAEAVRDSDGGFVTWAAPLTAVAEALETWPFARGVLAGITLGDPDLDVAGQGVFDLDGAVRPGVVERVDQQAAPFVADPTAMASFFRKKHKLIILQDWRADPFSTIDAYRKIAAAGGGLSKARAEARLFLVPGRGLPPHFDPLAVLEAWTQRGAAPDVITLSADAPPLCPWPEMARWDGHGETRRAAGWSCSASDARLLQIGPAGREAGVGLEIAPPQ